MIAVNGDVAEHVQALLRPKRAAQIADGATASASGKAAACTFRPSIYGVAMLCTFSCRPAVSPTALLAMPFSCWFSNGFAAGLLFGGFNIEQLLRYISPDCR
jgi:hypothetical protein